MKKILLFLIIAFTIIGFVFILETKGVITWRWKFNKTNPNLEVVFFDIGQGDAALLKFPGGKTMLVDCGKDASILSALGRNLSWSKRDLDYLVITHPHADHFGGCLDVLARFKVHNIYVNGYAAEHGTLLENFFQVVKNEERTDSAKTIILQTPQILEIGSSTVHFLYPDHELIRDPRIPGSKIPLDTNDTSVVMKVSFGTQDILLTGDMEIPLEQYLVQQNGANLQSEALKVGHHGSDSSSSEEFVETVKPKFCIISSGQGNSYGHPHGSTVRRLERAGCQVLRTDLSGDILMVLSTSSTQLENVQKP